MMSLVTSTPERAATAFPVRGLDEDTIRRLDVAARSRGMSRNAYVVEVLTEHARRVRRPLDRSAFTAAVELAADLGDGELMRSAWR
jgi:plasmid stability protein